MHAVLSRSFTLVAKHTVQFQTPSKLLTVVFGRRLLSSAAGTVCKMQHFFHLTQGKRARIADWPFCAVKLLSNDSAPVLWQIPLTLNVLCSLVMPSAFCQLLGSKRSLCMRMHLDSLLSSFCLFGLFLGRALCVCTHATQTVLNGTLSVLQKLHDLSTLGISSTVTSVFFPR